METSGYQPVPSEPGGFSPVPVPTPEPEPVAESPWGYSFVAEQPGALADVAESAEVAEPQAAEPVVTEFALEPPASGPAVLQQSAYDLSLAAPDSYLPEKPAVPSVPLPLASESWQADVVTTADTSVLLAESEADESAYLRPSTEAAVDADDINLNDLLMHILDTGASDLHLTSGARPSVRLNGALVQMADQPILTPPVIQRVMYAALTQKQREKFEEELELDFAYSVPGRARFRVNLYRQRDALGAAFRIIPFEIKKLEDLGIPPSVANFASLPRGFVLVTGPTGSGKSTTLASLVDLANRTRDEHIMTVEDPIEFLHRHQRCLVNQREVGEDTWSFANALKHVLRQDPDIILVGEMRDLETISVALTAAETGHLVFATLHTQDAAQTIDRIIDVFPTNQQQQVRVQLAGSLQGVVCQTLAKTRDGKGRAVATEVLVATPAIRNLIREGKTHQIYSAMQAGAKHGMHTMDQHLAELVLKGKITYEVGLEKCHHVEDFNRLAGRG
ncbi:MAG TPA: type IV pilus twitching motility protein PilT [Nocardioidaceae bacterium]|nr:type IV pilus twitching motility protein PilT [Nocardioidaceae bacterium]